MKKIHFGVIIDSIIIGSFSQNKSLFQLLSHKLIDYLPQTLIFSSTIFKEENNCLPEYHIWNNQNKFGINCMFWLRFKFKKYTS